jgi:hypothetical protein
LLGLKGVDSVSQRWWQVRTVHIFFMLATCSLLLCPSAAWSLPVKLAKVSNTSTDVVQVGTKNSKTTKKSTKKKNFGAGGYIPGHVKTPYGYKDCIGWWERHSNGRMQCHGQLVSSHI